MSIDPLQLLIGIGNSPRVNSSQSGTEAQKGFDKIIDEHVNKLNLLTNQDGFQDAALQKVRFGLLRGLLVEEDETSDDLFFSSGVDSLMVQTDALRSQMIDKYAGVQNLSLQTDPGSKDTDIKQLIDRVAERVSLAPDLIHAVVKAESNYKPDAVSHAGARGLMQLMPATAEELGVKDSFDPRQNLLGGSSYLKQLLDKYEGDLDHALAAYNWGQGNVDRHGLEKMPEETRTYIARVRQGIDGPA